MPSRRPSLLLVAALGAGCRSADEDPRVRIAVLEDRRVERPEAWEALLTRRGEEVRRRAARAVGRIRAPALAPVLVRALDVESSESVKGEQLFALGQIGDAATLGVLLRHLGGESVELRAAAAEAVGKLAVPQAAPNLFAHLVDRAPGVRGASLLALARLVGRRSGAKEPLDPGARQVLLQALASLLEDVDEGVRWKAAYALAEIEVDGRVELLLRAARSPEATARFFALGGLARLPAGATVPTDVIVERLDDSDPHVAAAAASVLARHGTAAEVPPLVRAAGAQGPARFHVRRAAIAALGEIRRRARVDPGLTERGLDDPSLTMRGEAMRLRAAGTTSAAGEPEIGAALAAATAAANRHERVAGVRALGAAPLRAVARPLIRLAADPDAYVASEAFAELAAQAGRIADPADPDGALGLSGAELAETARRGASHLDVAVAASALELLKRVGSSVDLALVEAAFRRMAGSSAAEARVIAVQVAGALADAQAAELLRRARADPSPAVAAAAKGEWKRIGLADDPPPARPREGVPGSEGEPGGPPSSVALVPGVDYLSAAPNPRVALQFEKGRVVIELLREEAPRHVKMMVTRVREGRCDGLPIHRVVSGFVVQGLDPRGDGWGTGGVFLRDEIQRVSYERGTVGMPNAGRDSGGCQLFVTLVPTPHLDGRYTVFGRVVAGMEVVDALDLGDVCTRAELVR